MSARSAEALAAPFPSRGRSDGDSRSAALVEELVASSLAEPRTRHIDAGPPPSREAVVKIIGRLQELLFPGYFGQQDLTTVTLPYHVADVVGSVRRELFEQVLSALRHRAMRHGLEIPDARDAAASIVEGFLSSLPAVRATLATDVEAAFDGDPAATDTDEIIFAYPGIFAISVYRVAHELSRLGVPLIPRTMTEHAHSLTGIDIHPGATIGDYFFIDHGTGVVIGETTIIGRRAKIYQGVTLGALSTRGGQSLRGVKRHPTLEDDVTVYSGASILGAETVVGEGVVISSNVFLTRSVPAHTRVSTRNPELRYRNRAPQELRQDAGLDWSI